jgi:hypothetical protein
LRDIAATLAALDQAIAMLKRRTRTVKGNISKLVRGADSWYFDKVSVEVLRFCDGFKRAG